MAKPLFPPTKETGVYVPPSTPEPTPMSDDKAMEYLMPEGSDRVLTPSMLMASDKLQEAKDILASQGEHTLAGRVGAVLRELKETIDERVR